MAFCELLNECFFKKEINEEIQKKEKELEVLQGSALKWSDEKMKEIKKYLKNVSK